MVGYQPKSKVILWYLTDALLSLINANMVAIVKIRTPNCCNLMIHSIFNYTTHES